MIFLRKAMDMARTRLGVAGRLRLMCDTSGVVVWRAEDGRRGRDEGLLADALGTKIGPTGDGILDQRSMRMGGTSPIDRYEVVIAVVAAGLGRTSISAMPSPSAKPPSIWPRRPEPG